MNQSATYSNPSGIYFPKALTYFFLFSLILLQTTSFAAVRTSTAAGGNWNSSGTWVGGTIPSSSDDVVIATTSGNSVTLTANAICSTVTINSGAVLNGGSFELQLRGAGTSFVKNGAFNPQTGTFFYTNAAAVNITTGAYNNLKFGGNGIKNIPGGVIVNGILSGSGGSPTMSTGTMVVSGAWTLSSAFVPGNGKVHYNGAGAIRSNTYHDLEISGEGVKTTSGSITVNGTLTVNSGGSFQTASASNLITLNKTGTALINNGTINSGILTYAGAGTQEIAGGTYNRITLSGGNKIIPTGTNLEVDNQFIVNAPLEFQGSASAVSKGILSGSGDITMGTGSITFLTTFTNSGVFDPGTGTIIYAAEAGNQTMSSRPYYNLKTTGAGIKIFASGDFQVGGDFEIQATTNLANSTKLYIEGDILGSGAFKAGTASSIIALKGDWIHNGTFDMNAGVVLYDGLNQQIRVQDYNVLQLANGTKTITSDLTINKKLEILSGNLDIGIHTLNIAAAGSSVFANNGTLSGTGKVLFSSALAQTIPGGTYPKLEFSGGTKSIQTGSNINVSTDWIVNSIVDINGLQNIIITGNIEGAGPISMGDGTIRLNGNWTNTGVFDSGNSTVIFEGANQIVPGNVYANLEIHNSGTKTLSGNITAEALLIDDAGSALNTASFTITLPVSGTPFVNNGTLAGEGTVHYSATGNQIIAPADYYNLTIGTGSKTIENGVDLIIANDLTVTGTTVLTGSAGLDIGGDLLGTAALTLNSGSIYIAGNWLKSGAFTPNSGTVIYDGTDQQVAGLIYYNLETNNSGVKELQGNTTISNVLTVKTPSVFRLNIHTVNLTGAGSPFVIDGTVEPETSTVNYSNSASTTVAAAAYNNLNISGGSRTIPADGTVSIAGDFMTGGGPFTVTGSTIEFNGDGSQTIPEFTFFDLVISNGGIKTIGTPVTVKSITIEDGPELNLNTDIGGELNIEN